MDSGISVFMSALAGGLTWAADGCLSNWLAMIAVGVCVTFKILKNEVRSSQFLKVGFIAGVWGTLYGISLIGMALGNPQIPRDKVYLLFFSGMGVVFQPLVIATLGWLGASLVDLLRPVPAQK